MDRSTRVSRGVCIALGVVAVLVATVAQAWDIHFEGPSASEYLDKCDREKENEKNREAVDRVMEGSHEKEDMERACQWVRDNVV